MVEGFITADHYAAVPLDKKQLVIIYNGQQLGTVSGRRQAYAFIKKHKEDNPVGVEKFTK